MIMVTSLHREIPQLVPVWIYIWSTWPSAVAQYRRSLLLLLLLLLCELSGKIILAPRSDCSTQSEVAVEVKTVGMNAEDQKSFQLTEQQPGRGEVKSLERGELLENVAS